MTATDHVGITVADLRGALTEWKSRGFTETTAFEVDGVGAARANGLESLHMSVRFLTRDNLTVEIIEHHVKGRQEERRSGEQGFAEYCVRLEDVYRGRHQLILEVTNPERSAALYEQLGDAQRGPAQAVGDRPSDELVFRDDLQLILRHAHLPGSPQPQPNDVGNTHVAFTVDDLGTLYGELATTGVNFVTEPQVEPGEGPAWCFVRDPGGGPNIELIQW